MQRFNHLTIQRFNKPMAYDPTLPANNSPIVSAELRNQLAGLKDLIDQKLSLADVQTQINTLAAGECSEVDDFQLAVSNPPTQAEVQAIADALHALVFYLKKEE
jgi:hypothetical protein